MVIVYTCFGNAPIPLFRNGSGKRILNAAEGNQSCETKKTILDKAFRAWNPRILQFEKIPEKGLTGAGTPLIIIS